MKLGTYMSHSNTPLTNGPFKDHVFIRKYSMYNILNSKHP